MLLLFFLGCFVAVSSGCSDKGSDNPQKTFGIDSNYFIGLQMLKNNQPKKAAHLFRAAERKGTPYVARRSAEELAKMGSVRDRIASYRKLLKTYNDEETLIAAVREFSKDREYALVITATDGLNLTSCDNTIARFRFEAMQKKSDSRLGSELYSWFTQRALSKDHYDFYTEYFLQSFRTSTKEEDTDTTISGKKFALDNAQHAIITFRIKLYNREYQAAATMFPIIENLAKYPSGNSDPQQGELLLFPQLVSDMGKACLYGRTSWMTDAVFFRNLAEEYEKKDNPLSHEIAFYAYFYAGRLYSKGDGYYTRTSDCLAHAMRVAPTPENFDNALWYYLNTQLSRSTSDAITAINKYRSQWYDPSYFDDFFESLSTLLFSGHDWNDFYKIYKIIDGYASDEIVAKYAYLSGRLIQEKLANTQSSSDESIEELFHRALKSGTDTYYKVMSAGQLNLDGAEFEQSLADTKFNPDFKEDTDMEKLLLGYAAFGFPEYIYSEWYSLTKNGTTGISLQPAEQLSSFLNACANNSDRVKDKNKYYPQSLRIITRTSLFSNQNPDRNTLEQMYPRNFNTEISDTCQKFELPEYILYSLVRSESFFDPDIESYAGAVGLTQLMNSTADDVARKLKRQTYDLTDPSTNIEFGGYYLSEMLQRLDNSAILAFFAYNGGIAHVRRWIRNSQIELGKTTGLPYDLFLETIPFSETREYGRKLVSAAVMYGWLYYKKNPSEITTEIMQ